MSSQKNWVLDAISLRTDLLGSLSNYAARDALHYAARRKSIAGAWSPGNGTRYTFALFRIDEHQSKILRCTDADVWLFSIGAGGALDTLALPYNCEVAHRDYLHEKLGNDERALVAAVIANVMIPGFDLDYGVRAFRSLVDVYNIKGIDWSLIAELQTAAHDEAYFAEESDRAGRES